MLMLFFFLVHVALPLFYPQKDPTQIVQLIGYLYIGCFFMHNLCVIWFIFNKLKHLFAFPFNIYLV